MVQSMDADRWCREGTGSEERDPKSGGTGSRIRARMACAGASVSQYYYSSFFLANTTDRYTVHGYREIRLCWGIGNFWVLLPLPNLSKYTPKHPQVEPFSPVSNPCHPRFHHNLALTVFPFSFSSSSLNSFLACSFNTLLRIFPETLFGTASTNLIPPRNFL